MNAAYARGSCQNKLGDYIKAIEDYKLALSKDEERFHMIFAPYSYRQASQTHRNSCSCSLLLLDNILTKSATPRAFASYCSGVFKQQLVEKKISSELGTLGNTKIESERVDDSENAAKFSPIIRRRDCDLNIQEKPRDEIINTCSSKRSLSPFLKRSSTKKPKPVLTEIETNCGNYNKGLERFLNPAKKNVEVSDTANNSKKIITESLSIIKPVTTKDLSIETSTCSPLASQKNGTINEKYSAQGYQTFDQKDYKNAVYFLTRAIDTGNASAKTLDCRGMSYFHLGNYQPALDDVSKAIELSPNDVSLYCHK